MNAAAAADEPGDSFPITEYVIHIVCIVVGMEKFTATSTTTTTSTCSSHISHTFLSHLDDSLFTRFFLLLAHWVGNSKENSAKILKKGLLKVLVIMALGKWISTYQTSLHHHLAADARLTRLLWPKILSK